MIKTIVFDIGNVLMRFEYKSYVKKLLGDDDLIEKVNDAIWRTGYWNELDLGYDPELVFSKMLAAGPDYQNEIRMVIDNVGQCIGRAEYAKDWIKGLKERGFQILFLSNYSQYIMQAAPEALDFLPSMDGGIFSCNIGLIKPDLKIFRSLCEEYRLDPEECVFIDDNKDNIKAAQRAGFHTVHFVEFIQAKDELEEIIRGIPD